MQIKVLPSPVGLFLFGGMSKERKPILPKSDGKPVKSNLTQLDRIKAYYIDGIKLDKADETYRRRLQVINHWFEEGITMSEARNKLQREDKFSAGEANKTVLAAMDLYGQIGKTSREGLRNLLTNHYLRLAKLAEAEKNAFVAGQLLERAARLNNLSEIQEKKKKGRIKSISYSRNPDVLKKNEEERAG